MRVLSEMNTRVMGQIAELEGNVDDAADMIQYAQQNPCGPRGRPNVGHDAFAGQGHRIRSLTPTPEDRSAQGVNPSIGQGGGISRPGAAAREASGDDLHSALGRSSAKDAVAPLTASKAMAE